MHASRTTMTTTTDEQSCCRGWPVPDLRVESSAGSLDRGLVSEVAIRTPDQRLRVFVSSTLEELAEERRAVSRAISALRLIPVMFELGARPHPPQEVYRSYLAQSDVFIGLYWQRYGWVGPGMTMSGLEEEFDLSRELPRLLYVKAPAPSREPSLADLLERIREQATDSYRTFGTPAELARLVRDDLALLLSERLRDRFDAGTVFVPLAAVTEPVKVLDGVARSVGADLAATGSPLQALAETFGGGAWLLILDNLEQVVQVADDLGELLERAPGVV